MLVSNPLKDPLSGMVFICPCWLLQRVSRLALDWVTAYYAQHRRVLYCGHVQGTTLKYVISVAGGFTYGAASTLGVTMG